MSADGFAVFTPLMKSRTQHGGWFAFATDVDNLRMIRWRLSRQLISPAGAKPVERLRLTESSCSLVDEGASWTHEKMLAYPLDLLEAGAIVFERFERLTHFKLEGEIP